MSAWLRNSPLRSSARPKRPPTADPAACFESFCHHWQQADNIIKNTQGGNVPSHDDVSVVINHLDYLITLLLLEIRQISGDDETKETTDSTINTNGRCLEQLLSENLLDKLYEWGSHTGRYLNVVRLEQIKLYSLLVQHFGKQLICAEPFLRPLLKLLRSFHTDIPTVDVEGKLVTLLGQVCVVLMQNPHYIDLFFFPPPYEDSIEQSRFIPVTLLLPHCHREDSLGQQARAALLLCAVFSSRNNSVAEFITNRSNMCLVLATGLSALYSSLPRKIDVSQSDWHRLTPDDVNDISQLSIFMSSLEFCNAVAQVAHSTVRNQLLDFFYQGFLLPVMGPALLQKKRGQTTTRPHYLQSGVEEQIAAIAYLELSFRSVNDPGLLKSLIKFLMDKNYNEANILDNIIPFLNGDSKLSIVTISLLETLVDLNCEDLMLELVLKYLIDGKHLMVSDRQKSLTCDVQCKGTSMFLALSPDCCGIRPQVPYMLRKFSTTGARKLSVSSIDQTLGSMTSFSDEYSSLPHRPPQNLCAYGLNANESLYGNYHAYLCEARRKILSCKKSCLKWSTTYDQFSVQNDQTNSNSKNSIIDVVKNFQLEHSNLIKDSNADSPSDISNCVYTNKEHDSLQSIGESSGYESFKYKSEDTNCTPETDESFADNSEFSENSFWKNSDVDSLPKISHTTVPASTPKNISYFNSNDVNIGPLLTHTLSKLSEMLDNNVYVNLRLTGLITKLATYPLPLLRSFLLCPWIVLQPAVTSLYQILLSIKQEIDESVLDDPDCFRLVEDAQSFLIDREIRLANTRKNAIESTSSKPLCSEPTKNALLTSQLSQNSLSYSETSSQPNSGNWEQPSTVQQMSVSEPFKRNEPKRRSISSSISMMGNKLSSFSFRGKINAGGMLNSSSNTNPPIEPPNKTVAESSNTSYIQNITAEDNLWQTTKTRKTILNAIILDEWIKELGALAQEHVVCSISDMMQESSTNELIDKIL